MQNIATMNSRQIGGHAEGTGALKNGAKRLVQRALGCWQHDLGRPFSRWGRTYRVCVKCGMARDFNPVNWETHGPSYRLPADLGYSSSMSTERKAA